MLSHQMIFHVLYALFAALTTPMPKNRHYLLRLFILSAILPGCSWRSSMDAAYPKQSFATYAETVFRRQNNATSQIMMMTLEDGQDPKALEPLLDAEKQMQQACTTLVIYAEQSQNNPNTSLLLRARTGKSISACDLATQTLEALLIKHKQDIVSYQPAP